ncbi:WD40 repeat domain-containing protein [Streptomyces sp. NPDC002787]
MRQLAVQEHTRFPSGFGHPVTAVLGAGPDGIPLLFSSVPDGSEISRWDMSAGKQVWCYDEGMSGCNDLALVRLPGGGPLLAAATEDGIEWWDALTGAYRSEMAWEDSTVWALSAGTLPDGRPALFGAGHDGEVYRWDGATGEPLGSSGGRGPMMAVGFVPSPDGSGGVLVSGDESGRVWRWDPVTGDRLGEPIVGHSDPVRIIAPLPTAGEPLFVSSDQEGLLQRWNAVTGSEVGPAIETGTQTYALASARVDGTPVLFAAGDDENVRAWDAASGEPIDISLRSTVVSALTQPDGTTLLVTSTDKGDIVVHECATLHG